jgi:glucokinase
MLIRNGPMRQRTRLNMHKHNDGTGQTTMLRRDDARVPQNGVSTEGAGYVAGVDVGGTNLRLAVADLNGTVLARWTSSTAGVRGADAVIRLISDGLRHTLVEIGASLNSLRSFAAGVPGITNFENGTVIATSYLLGWRDVPLRMMLEEQLGVPAAVDNDVNLAAIGERWAGSAKGCSDFVFMAIGTGIGAGIVLDGRPYRGSSWAAGEIGYMLLPGTIGGPGKSGEPGALESLIGGEGVKAQWQAIWTPDRTTLPRDLTATEIFDHALDGDELAQKILQRSATMLAQAIYNISLVLNCPLFVLGGGVGKHSALQEAAQNVLQQWHVRGQPQVIASALGADAQLMGAVRLALDMANVEAPWK